jgi:type IV pilus assembly protein PilB
VVCVSNDVLIGELLVRAGLLDPAALSRAREAQQKQPTSLVKALGALGLADEDSICTAIAEALHLERLSENKPEILPDVLALLPGDFCRKRMVLPLTLQGKTLRVAFANPMDYVTIQDVEFRSGKRVSAVVASESLILSLLDQCYAADVATLEDLPAEDPHGEVESLEDTEFEIHDPAKLAKDTKMPPVIRLVNLILSGAAQSGASDIHMEPKESHLQVRYRVDGLLRDVLKVSKNQQDAAISRIKIISGMDIADRRRPQDGRSRLRFEGKRIDLRVSTLPTQFGEKVVVRLLDGKRAQVTMEQLNLTPDNQRTFESMLSRSQGMILVTGPTGSGKTSTLYTALNWVKSPTKNIITVEDPIEYQLDGVNQVQINTRAGVTFAAGLRSILRQDPNIILVGEIRDRETAGIGLEAAQTGHLLLSTLHTNDAPGAVTRLLDLGIEPFLISSAVIGILAQRLVGRPCPACQVSQPPVADLIEKAGGASRLPPGANWVEARGCPECRESGYKGRIAVHELLIVNDEVRELITRRGSEHAIRKAARNAGMRTLLEDGILKAAQGLTTLADVVRVVASDESAVHKEHATRPEPLASVSDSVSVPMDDAPAPASSTAPPAQREAAPKLSGSEDKQRVLVVEDSATIASVVKYFLELEGFEVLVAKDGEAGLESARRDRPNVIVTDCNMPGMDGMTMVKELRRAESTRDVAVLMLTSEEGIEKEAQALEAGVDDYIVKPVEPRRLAARVRSVLAHSRSRGAAVVQ